MRYIITEKQLLKIVKNINEAPTMAASLVGNKPITIPRDGAHKGQKGWPSGNAWDIKTNIGDPVYAIASGKVMTFSDYGPKVIKKDGKKIFGIGMTIKSDGNLPDVFYTHLQNAQVKKGDKVECGQLLGYVMDFPGSSYDHVHIGVEYGHNIREFIGPDGKLKCSKGMNLDKVNFGDLGKLSDDMISKFDFNVTDVLKQALGIK